MAAPNIVGVTTIVGITTGISLTVTPTSFLSNPASSNKVLKVNTIMISNIDGAASADVNIKYHPSGAAGAGTSISLAHTIAVAQDTALVALDKASSIYLQENQSLVAYASAAGDLDLVCSYEEIQ